MKPFNFELAIKGAEVITRDGRKVESVREEKPDAPFSYAVGSMTDRFIQGLRAKIHNDLGLMEFDFYHDGGAHKYGGDNGCDLFMAEPSDFELEEDEVIEPEVEINCKRYLTARDLKGNIRVLSCGELVDNELHQEYIKSGKEDMADIGIKTTSPVLGLIINTDFGE